MGAYAEIDRRTQRIGRELFARINRQGPLWFTPAWADDLLLGLTMSDPTLKVQLFRFIDTLPRLESPHEVSGHLYEYLAEAATHLPPWARWGMRLLPQSGWGSRLLAWSAKWNARRLARRFIAGSNVQEALQAIAQMRQAGLAFTLDLLGEATITEAEAQMVQRQYLELLEGLPPVVNQWPSIEHIDCDDHGPIPRVNVSVKLSALYSQFDPIDPTGTGRAVGERLRPILRLARQQRAFVNFDMEQYAFKDVTLQIFRDILSEDEFRDWPDVGIAIQAYLRDSEADLQALLHWVQQRGTPVTIRLVKGAYWDYETVIAAQHGWPVPVFQRKWQSDANFEKLTRFLMENYRWLRPAFGSHNIRSIAHALAVADELRLPAGSYEFQMLYGMADEIKEALLSMNQRVRIYTPYGQLLPGMAYLVRRLLENTSNDSFLRASFSEHLPEEQLLMNPTMHAVTNGSPTRQAADANHAAHLNSAANTNRDANAGGTTRVSSPANTSETTNASGTVHASGAANGPAQAEASAVSWGPFRNEPLADFSREANRQAMQAALDEVTKQLGQTYPLLVAGEAVDPGRYLESRNPSHCRQIVGRVAQARQEDALRAIAAAEAAFPAWRDTPAEQRAEFLRRIAAGIRARRWELAAWAVVECGKPWREADADIAEAIDFCEYYAREMLRLAQPRRVELPGEVNETIYEPRGVAVVIAPWNFPLAILCGMTTAALVTGNPVIMKPAEQSSVIAAKFLEILTSVGLPTGVVQYLPGVGEEIGPTLVSAPQVALIAFTGSLPVGVTIQRQAAETPPQQTHIKRVIAELGGKNAIIIDADADLDEAVRGVVESAFGYQGQKCSAGSRVIVLESIYEVFLNRLIEATKSLTVGPAEAPGTGVGPVIDAEARDRILRMIEQGRREAKLVYAADVGTLADEGYYVGPHIFAEVPPTATIAQEEIFGPVLAVLQARDLDEALRIANGTKFALTGGVFSRSPKNLAEVKRRFHVGNLYINRKITGALVHRQPFGGFKLSGIGSKAGGPDYLLQFVVPRTITENTMRRGFAPEITE